MIDLEAVRQDIPSLDRAIYLNTGGVGPITKRVYEFLDREFTERYLNGSPLNMRPQSLQMEKNRARKTMADLLAVDAGEICFTRGVADGTNMITRGLPWKAGDEIITTDEENPSFLLPALMLKGSDGVVVRFLRLDNNRDVILERLRALLNSRTRLVAISHVTTDNGIRLPAKEICDLAHEAGAPIFFDGAQAVGRFEVDLKEIGCDFYGLLSYKWLLGPYTAGLLYIAEDKLDTVKVTLSGERADKSIDRVAGTFELLDTAQRFEYGPHGWPLYFAMAEAVRYLRSLGMDEIRAQARTQAAYLRQGLKTLPGVSILSPEQPDTLTSVVTFAIEGIPGQDIVSAFRGQWNIITRATNIRADGVRVSVAFFSTREEMDTVIEAVAAIAGKR